MGSILAAALVSGTNVATNVQSMDSSHFDLAAWITALATFALVVAAMVVAVIESRRHRFARSIDLILQFEEKFTGDQFLKQRDAAAKCLKTNAFKSSGDKCAKDADAVLDFFETIGYLLRRGALDEKMVWHTFWHWIMGYYQAAEEYISDKRSNAPTVWEDFVELHRRMGAIERYTISNDDFLSEEILD